MSELTGLLRASLYDGPWAARSEGGVGSNWSDSPRLSMTAVNPFHLVVEGRWSQRDRDALVGAVT